MTVQPKYLEKGDRIAIVSTARKITKVEIQQAISLLKSWGLEPVIGKTIGVENHQFAGNDELRITDFQQMLDDESIKAIWCARGGYGTVRLVDEINFKNFINQPKWIIGYSDVTVLHSHIHNLGIKTLHATMPVNVSNNTSESLESLRRALFGESLVYHEHSSIRNQYGSATGILVGGNLSILYSLLGSESSINTKGKILFIEDLDEYLYHIDRMMMNLKRNRYFDEIGGLIVGGMTKMHDNTIPFGNDASGIICDILGNFSGPICFEFPSGHLDNNKALVLGHKVELDVNKKVTLKF